MIKNQMATIKSHKLRKRDISLIIKIGDKVISQIQAVLMISLRQIHPLKIRQKISEWNLFDFIIVGLSLFASAGISVLRALRIFRAMRLLSVLPQMRLITEAMLHTLPSLFGVAILLFIFYYVYAVLCVNLFGADFPQYFGSLGTSFFTLFRLMIMDDFGNIVRPIIDRYAYAWVVFVSFVLIVGFVVLNLVVGIIVESISEIKGRRDS